MKSKALEGEWEEPVGWVGLSITHSPEERRGERERERERQTLEGCAAVRLSSSLELSSVWLLSACVRCVVVLGECVCLR